MEASLTLAENDELWGEKEYKVTSVPVTFKEDYLMVDNLKLFFTKMLVIAMSHSSNHIKTKY